MQWVAHCDLKRLTPLLRNATTIPINLLHSLQQINRDFACKALILLTNTAVTKLYKIASNNLKKHVFKLFFFKYIDFFYLLHKHTVK